MPAAGEASPLEIRCPAGRFIGGVIVDENGGPRSGLLVSVSGGKRNHHVRATVSDVHGRFRLAPVLPDVEYKLFVRNGESGLRSTIKTSDPERRIVAPIPKE
ncbi:MAG TPA: carboxypeptidase-like regulatory domain-containing protein [Planctomycetia bacterium]|nr:carboxypeptidase-like regulatory domain-containing protein [Planctomycetia bacterium]